MFARDFSPIDAFRREVDALFQDTAGAWPFAEISVAGRNYPALNAWEDNDNLFLEAEVPGTKSEDLEIQVLGNEVSIKGRINGAEQNGGSVHRRERLSGSFSRTMVLPVEVDQSKVTAALKDGVLTVTLPKAESARPRKIAINNNN